MALSNATVFDAVGPEPVEETCVVVEGKEIKDLTRRVPAGADVTEVDCAGAWVLPGLIDAHVHIGAVDHNPSGQQRRYSQAYLAFRVAERLRVMLESGFTTVRDAGGADFGFKQAIEDGLIPGPRLLVSLKPICQTGGHGDSRTQFEPGDFHPYEGEFGATHVIADGVDEVRKAAREQLRRGADVIKVMASGGAVSEGPIDATQYSVEELRAIAQEATARGTYVMAHALTPSSIRNCLAAGVRCIEHGNFVDRETCQAMAEASVGLVPTILAYEYDAEHGERYQYSKHVRDKLAQGAASAREGLRLATEAGVRVGSGSDMIGDLVDFLAREIRLKAEVIGAGAALMATTRVNAEICGLADRLGTVEPGKLADLIVVADDPLARPEILEKKDALRMVIKGGEIVHSGIAT